MQDIGPESITPKINRINLEGIDGYSNFEAQFSGELTSIQADVVAYQHAFGENLNAPPVLVNVWKLGAPEVHRGGHSAHVWLENRSDRYGQAHDVLVIQNGYHPSESIQHTTTYELSAGTAHNAESAVALRMVHQENEGNPYKLQTLLTKVTPSKLHEMMDLVKSAAAQNQAPTAPEATPEVPPSLLNPDQIELTDW